MTIHCASNASMREEQAKRGVAARHERDSMTKPRSPISIASTCRRPANSSFLTGIRQLGIHERERGALMDGAVRSLRCRRAETLCTARLRRKAFTTSRPVLSLTRKTTPNVCEPDTVAGRTAVGCHRQVLNAVRTDFATAQHVECGRSLIEKEVHRRSGKRSGRRRVSREQLGEGGWSGASDTWRRKHCERALNGLFGRMRQSASMPQRGREAGRRFRQQT